MKTFNYIVLVSLLLLTYNIDAQQTQTKKKSQNSTKQPTTSKIDKPMPTWAAAHNYKGDAHVYFPDYYTFYDANKGGYVFYKDGDWNFTPTVPPYMSSADLTKERVQILKGLDLDLSPETNYPRYMKLYPAVHEYNDVPVPVNIPGNQ